MKRNGLIAVLTAVMIMASSAFCFADAGDLEIESSYPRDGQKNTSIENVGVQLHFNGTFKDDSVRKSNEKLVKIENSKGKAIDIQVLFSDKEDGLVLVVADSSAKDATKIKSSEEYKLVIDGDFADDNGNTLGKDTSIEFKTYNQRLNNMVNIAMMVVMFGGIMVLTIKQQRDQQAEKEAEKNEVKEAAFNPYREAKKTGKSVEEVMAEEAKRQEKLNKKKKKKHKTEDAKHIKIENCADYLNNVYRVHEPRPIKKNNETEVAPKSSNKKGKGGKR